MPDTKDNDHTFIDKWLTAFDDPLAALENPINKKKIGSVKEVTYHDFSTYVYVLDPWAKRVPLPSPNSWQLSEQDTEETPAAKDEAPKESTNEGALSWLREDVAGMIDQFLSDARTASSNPNEFDEATIRLLISRFVTQCFEALSSIYSLGQVDQRLNHMVLVFVERGLSLKDLVDNFVAMTDGQRTEFYKSFDKATAEWVERSSMFDMPWRVPAITRLLPPPFQARTSVSGGFVYHDLTRPEEWPQPGDDFQDTPYWKATNVGQPEPSFDCLRYGKLAHDLAWNGCSADRDRLPAVGFGTTIFEYSVLSEDIYLTITFEPYTGDFRNSPVKNLGSIAKEIRQTAPVAEQEETKNILGWLDDLVTQLKSGLAEVKPQTQVLPLPPKLPGSSPYRQYGFQPYPSNTINLGLQITYRQEWTPRGVAKGDLLKTIPLGPGQSEKVVFRQLERNRLTRKSEDVSETETTQETNIKTTNSSEIVEEAASSHNWLIKADGSFNVGIGPVSFGGSVQGPQYSGSTQSSSKETKSQLAEAMQRASSKIRRESKLSVEMEREVTTEITRTSEIKNPNDEIPVTYYYYALQQQFDVHTFLATLEPVFLVAERMPKPIDITLEWIRRNDWLLSKALLDPSYSEALSRIAAVDPEEMLKEIELSKEEVSNLSKALTGASASLGSLQSLQGSVDNTYEAALRAYQDAIRSARQLGREYQGILNQARRLAGHIIDNILHYCRAIWSAEDPDRRRMRYTSYLWPTEFRPLWNDTSNPTPAGNGAWNYRGRFEPVTGSEVPLSELVDPSGPIAFAGNYAVFRMLRTERTVGYTPLLRQAALAYYADQTFKTSPAGVTAAVTNLDLYAGEAYLINITGTDPKLASSYYVVRQLGRYEESVPFESLLVEALSGGKLRLVLADGGVEIILDQPPSQNDAIQIIPDEPVLQDPELMYLKNRYPNAPLEPNKGGEKSLKERLEEQSTREVLIDTGNVHLDIDPEPLLEPFKQYHRMLDVIKMAAEVLRLNTRLKHGIYSDPDVQKVIIVADNDLAKQVAADEANNTAVNDDSDSEPND